MILCYTQGMEYEEIVEKLRADARGQYGIGRVIASDAGITPQAVSEMIIGKKPISSRVLSVLLRNLGYTLELKKIDSPAKKDA